MQEHETHLLEGLADRYTAMVLTELEREQLDDVDEGSMLQRCEHVFARLWQEGEESRVTLWDHATRMVSVRNPDAAKLAWSQVVSHPKGPEPQQCSAFVAAMAQRLKADAEDEDNWGVDWDSGGRALLKVVDQRLADFDEGACEGLADLAVAWSRYDECATYACRVIEAINRQAAEQFARVVNDWIERLFDDLPLDCGRWLCGHAEIDLGEAQRKQLVKALDAMVQQEAVSEDDGQRYQTFLAAAPGSALEQAPFQGHLQVLCQQVKGQHGNPSGYLEHVFPALPPVAKHCLPNALGDMLHTLFKKTKHDPEFFGWLHKQMAEHWPERDGSLGPYEPKSILDDAITMAQEHPGASAMDGAVRSAAVLATKVVTDGDQGRVAVVACALWPHHPDAAEDVLEQLDVSPQPSDVADLAKEVDPPTSRQ